MLPGIRFLLAAILLSTSILIFGLGAAALLRAAHEEVANVPARRVIPEPVFAQQTDPPLPTLSLLRVEPAVPEKAPDAQPAGMPVPEPAPEAVPVPNVETETLAALKADAIAPAETATPEPSATPEVERKPDAETKPDAAAAETPAAQPAAAEPPPAAEPKLAAVDAPPSLPVEAAPVPPEQTAEPATTDAGLSAMKAAALGDPLAKLEKPAEANKADEKSDRAELRRQQRAERAKERRRQAARRARLAAQQAAATPQVADPFSLMTQTTQPATTTRRR